MTNRRFARLLVESLEERRLLAIDSGVGAAAIYSPLDVNQDGFVSGIDALLVVNEINRQQAAASPAAASLPDAAMMSSSAVSPNLDIDGDGAISPADAQLVLDALDDEAEPMLRIRLEITDLAGNPISQIAQGSQFLLKTYALDLRAAPSNTGVYAAFADVTWDAALASVVNGSIDHGAVYVTGVSGTGAAGLLDELGGISGQISPQLGPAERLLTTVTLQADAPGPLHFAGDPADITPKNNSLLFDFGGAVPTDLIEYGTADLLVLSTDPVTVSIEQPLIAVTEGDSGTTPQEFTVTLSAASAQTITVNYATSGVSAFAPNDFEAKSGTLTFLPGETSKTITINIVGDTRDDQEVETFMVTLSNPSAGAQLGTDRATGIINDDDPAPTLAISDPEDVTEGDDGTVSVTFTVTLSAVSDRIVSVNYSTLAGTAEAGTDFVAASGTLTFEPGETSKTIVVDLVGDLLDEALESFSVELSGASNADLDKAVGTVNIVDNDPAPSLQVGDRTLVEPDVDSTDMVFTVTLSEASGQEITVDYETIPGTAASPDDYDAVSGSLVFAPGETSKTIAVPIRADALTEGIESFKLRLTSTGVLQTTPVEATGTIADADVPTLSIADPDAITEGTGAATTLEFTVTLSQASTGTVTVDYTTNAGTAQQGSDYTPTSGTLTFEPGETTKTISVSVVGDALNEASETLLVTLSNPVNAIFNGGETTTAATGTILDDDAQPSVSISSPAAITEGNSGDKPLQFTVSLSAASGQTVTVEYATAPGTALAGQDYTTTSGTVTFAPGETSKIINVSILGDTQIEPNETFSVVLSNPTNASLDADTATGTITDDDDLPQIGITSPSAIAEGTETNPVLSFTVTLSKASTETVTVNYATTAGSAAQGTDYTGTSGTLTFAPGETSKTIPVTILADAIDELDETFTMTLSSPSSNAVLAEGQSVATGTIADDDAAPEVSIATPAIIAEGADTKTLSFTVTLSAASSQTVTVDYSTANGTALAGSDYTAVSDGTVTFNPGETSKTISITILGDAIPEPTETFTVTLTDPTNATLATATATGTIADDDAMVTISDATLIEGHSVLTQMQFTVSLSAAQDVDVTVRVNSHNGTALANVDYRLSENVLVTIPAGETSVTVSIDIAGDRLPEADETFTLELSNPTNATLGDKTIGTGTIINDDPLVAISGYAYIDLNNDGVKNPGEKGLVGVMVRLTGQDIAGEPVDQTQLTGADGSYNFQNLNPGLYRVVESQPAGLLDGKDRLHHGGLASVNDQMVITLGAESLANNNFGERGLPPQQITKRNFFAANPTVIPSTPPAVAITGGTTAVNIANAHSTTATGTGTPGAFIALVAKDGVKTSVGHTTTVAANGTWSITGIDVSMLKDGSITYQVAVSDAYGNAALASRAATKTTVAITSATTPVFDATSSDVTVTGTGQPGAAIKLVASDTATPQHTVEATTTIAADGTWSITGFDIHTLFDGEFSYVVTATDADDNTATATRKGLRGQ